MEFGAKLQMLREQRGMTLNELAKLTGYATHTPLSLLENGKRKPTLDFVYKVAELFEVSFDLLLNDNVDLEG